MRSAARSRSSSGRSIADLDRLFSPQRWPAAGLHGLERRDALGRTTAPSHGRARLATARAMLDAIASQHPRVCGSRTRALRSPCITGRRRSSRTVSTGCSSSWCATSATSSICSRERACSSSSSAARTRRTRSRPFSPNHRSQAGTWYSPAMTSPTSMASRPWSRPAACRSRSATACAAACASPRRRTCEPSSQTCCCNAHRHRERSMSLDMAGIDISTVRLSRSWEDLV